MQAATATKTYEPKVRFADHGAREWVWRHSPQRFRKRAELVFQNVAFKHLEIAGSLRHGDVIARWQQRLARGYAIPALVASATPHGTFYLHDGNHRYFAMREHFGEQVWELPVRVALLRPTAGYQWHYHWFGSYGTWLLKPARPWPEDYARGWNPQVAYAPPEPEALLA